MDVFRIAGSIKITINQRVETINEERQNRERDVCAAVKANEPCSSGQLAYPINMNEKPF